MTTGPTTDSTTEPTMEGVVAARIAFNALAVLTEAMLNRPMALAKVLKDTAATLDLDEMTEAMAVMALLGQEIHYEEGND